VLSIILQTTFPLRLIAPMTVVLSLISPPRMWVFLFPVAVLVFAADESLVNLNDAHQFSRTLARSRWQTYHAVCSDERSPKNIRRICRDDTPCRI